MGAIQSFGQMLPALTGTIGTVQTALGTVEAVRTLANPDREADMALDQLRARQNLQERQLAADAQTSREKIALDASLAEKSRQDALRRAVAKQRAQFGARGVGTSAGGSPEAVLLGLFEESDEERQKREQLDQMRLKSIDQNLSQAKSLNLLQATQLAERKQIERLF